ncbi:PREDICTED: ankyrin-3-like [Ceratosolen solmsi marchali]|uniref:Ankyrin-3-like n=1 Tax=Ceratosolen solmsi marchali TaxID=326594 RepID=A0AAJ6YD10_9HYME|nr:PREDICTED: ankyrin-3-like [Ceratosolen solmsi marchali]
MATLPPNQNALLHIAVLENNEKAVRFLLKHGAQPNTRMHSSKEQCLRYDMVLNAEMSDLLYRYRSSSSSCAMIANIQTLPHHKLNTTYDSHRNRSFSNTSDICKHFRQQQQQQQRSPMPLHVAAANGRRDIVELLLDYGAHVNAEIEGEYTPLVIAIILKQYEIARILIHEGANVNARSKNSKTPMHYAVKTKQIEIVQLLLSKGGRVNARTDHGVTPLHIAVERKLKDVAELLLRCGADVNAVTKTGVTPLHCAAVKGQREITELILKYGGDVSVIMKKGEIDVTPLLWVTEVERKKITDIVYRYVPKTSASGFYERFFKKIWKQLCGIRK